MTGELKMPLPVSKAQGSLPSSVGVKVAAPVCSLSERKRGQGASGASAAGAKAEPSAEPSAELSAASAVVSVEPSPVSDEVSAEPLPVSGVSVCFASLAQAERARRVKRR